MFNWVTAEQKSGLNNSTKQSNLSKTVRGTLVFRLILSIPLDLGFVDNARIRRTTCSYRDFLDKL